MVSVYTWAKMGKLSRTKGHSFERWVAAQLRSIWPKCRRHLEYQDGECFGVDIHGSGHYRIQCKRGKKPSPISAIHEVQYDEMLGEIPILITRGDADQAYVVVPFEEFKRLLALYIQKD